jgi:hypothetical protein
VARRILIGADYDGVSVSEPVGGSYRAVDPATLPLSSQTGAQLQNWAAWYDRGWTTADEETRFDAEGRRLWVVVRSELGAAFDVGYFSVVLRRILEPEAGV